MPSMSGKYQRYVFGTTTSITRAVNTVNDNNWELVAVLSTQPNIEIIYREKRKRTTTKDKTIKALLALLKRAYIIIYNNQIQSNRKGATLKDAMEWGDELYEYISKEELKNG